MTPPPTILGLAPAGLADLSMLEALHAEPSLSQRQLAREVGLPLSKVHWVLTRLVEKGMVKVKNVRDSKHKHGYLYVVTPSGIEAKAKLTYRFLQRTAADYQGMRERVEKALDVAIGKAKNGSPKVCVALLGDGPLGDVVRDALADRDDAEVTRDVTLAKVLVLIDREARRPEGSETAVVEFA